MKDALKMSGTKSTENGYTGDATTKSSIICVRFEFTELIHLQLSRLFFPSTRSVYHLVQLKRPWNRMLIGCRRRDHLEVNGRMGGLADETVTRVTSVYNLV